MGGGEKYRMTFEEGLFGMSSGENVTLCMGSCVLCGIFFIRCTLGSQTICLSLPNAKNKQGILLS